MKAWAKHFIPNSRGFTIIELLIVIVVIAILAAIIFFGYGAVQNNAQDTAFKAELTKIGDEIKLVTLDNNGVPVGGATSSLTGDSTVLSGVTVSPDENLYDLTSANLFYCSGDIDGIEEFAVVAKSQRGAIFSYISNGSVTQLSDSTAMSSSSVCPAAGFSEPYTWSYGYNPDPIYGWFLWAYDGAFITNLITNPSLESNITGWANYTGLGTPTRSTTDPWIGGARLSAVGSGTSTTPRVYINSSPVVEGDQMALSFRVRSDGQTPTFAYIAIKLTSGGGEVSTFYTDDVAWTPDTNDWVLATATFTVPSGGDGLRLSIGVRSAANYTGTMGIDGVMLVKGVDTVPLYADGSSLNWVWNGTANNSTSTGPAK